MTPFIFRNGEAKLQAMDGYSEIGAIYFAIANKTSVARYLKATSSNKQELLVTETYLGSPPYSFIRGRMPKLLKQYHAAEHQVYNCFMDKIRHLPARATLSEISMMVPTLAEVQNTKSHSALCGSTVYVSSAILLLGAAIPNLLKLHNTNLIFMSTWLAVIISIAYLASCWIQKKYYLATPNDKQLKLGLEALKEVLKNGK